MSEVMAVSALAADADAFFRARHETEPMLALRSRALTRYEELPVPHYEKSDISRRNLTAFTINSDAASSPSGALDWQTIAAPYLDQNGAGVLLVFADGKLVSERGIAALPQGIVVEPLLDAVGKRPELLKKLHTAVPFDENRLLALQAGLWRDGIYVSIARGVTFETPIQIVHVVTRGGAGSFIHNLYEAGDGSTATILETYLAASDLADHLHVGVTEAFIGQGARIKGGVVSDLPRRMTSVVVRRALVGRDAAMDWVVGEVGDGYTVSEIGSRLVGQGSTSTCHAVVLGSGRAHADLTARMVHEAKFSESDTTARGVMQGHAFGVYRGITHILKGASGSNGQQAEKLLMMSPESRADAIPMLLIDENDVKCGHAASVGQINEEQLFYLMSRGISEGAAKKMVVWGFLDPVLAQLPVDSVRGAVERVLERKMK